MKNKEIKLGQKVKDIVSGLTGITIAKVEYLNGCVQYAVKPKMKEKDTETPQAEYIDVEQLQVINDGIIKKKKITKNGGIKETPIYHGLAKI